MAPASAIAARQVPITDPAISVGNAIFRCEPVLCGESFFAAPAPWSGCIGDKTLLLPFGHAFPSTAGKAFEWPITDLVLHPLCPFDPIAEIDIGQVSFRRSADVVENDVVPKPGASLVVRIVEAVDHRQPVTLIIREASSDQAPLLGTDPRLTIFDHIARYAGVFHHICEIGFFHLRHPATGVTCSEIFLQQFEYFFHDYVSCDHSDVALFV